MMSRFIVECITIYHNKKESSNKPSYWDDLIALLTLEGFLKDDD